jgi:hypothetical protein
MPKKGASKNKIIFYQNIFFCQTFGAGNFKEL